MSLQAIQPQYSHHRLMSELISIMKSFAQMGVQSSSQLNHELETYLKLTDDQIGWMRRQGGVVLVCAVLSGVSGMASAFYPKTDVPHAALPSGSNFLTRAMDKLKDNNFMHTMLKSSATALPQLSQGAQMLMQEPITRIEALRNLSDRVYIQKMTQAKSNNEEAQRTIERVLTGLIGKDRLRGG